MTKKEKEAKLEEIAKRRARNAVRQVAIEDFMKANNHDDMQKALKLMYAANNIK